MKKNELTKKAWTIVPYLYFIGLAAFWFLGELIAKQNLSYFALGILLILTTQVIIQNKILGVILGLFSIVASTLFFLAAFSEFTEFKTITIDAIELISVGSILSLSGFAMGFVMTKTSGKTLVI